MPLAIIIGVLFHTWIAPFKALVPWLIFIILLLAYSSLHFTHLKLTKLNIALLVAHLLLATICYVICLYCFGQIVANGVLVGVICPVAASSSTIVVMLGGNKEISITHTLIDNVMIAFAAPLFFSIAGTNAYISFGTSVGTILAKISPIIILPLIIVIFLKRFAPKTNDKLKQYDDYSLVIWGAALMINFAQTTQYIIRYGKSNEHIIYLLSIISLILCALQFSLGKLLGKKSGQSVSAGQGLGQKNTGLGIWLAYTYFSPLTSIYPAAYSLWQNLFNSWQIYSHDKKTKQLQAVSQNNQTKKEFFL